jgi:hypothetical protein
VARRGIGVVGFDNAPVAHGSGAFTRAS